MSDTILALADLAEDIKQANADLDAARKAEHKAFVEHEATSAARLRAHERVHQLNQQLYQLVNGYAPPGAI